MISRAVLMGSVLLAIPASAQDDVALKSAVVTLSAEPALRAELEDGLVEKARQHSYNAVASHDLVPDVDDLDDRDFAKRMRANGVGAILMIRPAAAGSDASLESIKDDVSAGTYANMRAFARELGSAGEDDIIAVVHLAIYLVGDDGVELISSGAVWLDEQSPSRDEAIERLQNLIVANVDAVRPAIREHLGMPPLDRTAETDGAAPE